MATTSEPAATTGGDITRLPRNSPDARPVSPELVTEPEEHQKTSIGRAPPSPAPRLQRLRSCHWAVSAGASRHSVSYLPAATVPSPRRLPHTIFRFLVARPSNRHGRSEPAQIHLQLPRSLSDRGYTPICGLRDVRQFTLPGVTPNCLTAEAPTIAELEAVLALRRVAGIVKLASVD
jgi:hypothetical protein